ncbi:MAG: ComF family protein [Nitrospirota bacterium]|nr:ComF family protein [Nitrospirota bacterium]
MFPTPCCACGEWLGKEEKITCAVCSEMITPLPHPRCPRCSTPFTSEFALTESPTHLCGTCRKSPPPFDLAVSGGEYAGPLRDLLHAFKFTQRPDLAQPIIKLTMGTVAVPDADMIMAVPLHPGRLRRRGYNQSLLLAMEVGRILDIPLSIDDLARIRPTRPQMELKHNEREQNIAGAFKVMHPNRVDNKRVLLVDDIYTTGSTVRECGKMLKQSGAREVFVLTVAMVVL